MTRAHLLAVIAATRAVAFECGRTLAAADPLDTVDDDALAKLRTAVAGPMQDAAEGLGFAFAVPAGERADG